MPKKRYKIGVVPAHDKDKSIVVVIPKRPSINVEKDIEWVRYRIADAFRIPVELLDPSPHKIRDHPAFDNGATIIRLSARGTIPKKPNK